MTEGSFLVGVNLPWFHYGGDVGANTWRPDGGIARPDRLAEADAALGRLADQGVTVVRWFLLCDARAGVLPDPDGGPAGLDEAVSRDLDAALGLLEKHRLQAMFALLDFLLARRARDVDGVRTGGRAAWLRREDWRQRLVERVLVPVATRVAGSAALHSWDLLNEPEWITLGWGGLDPRQSVPQAAMRSFLGDCVSGLRSVASTPITVGLASVRGLPLVAGLGLDFYQVHWYDHVDPPASLAVPAADWKLDAPLLLGEFPTAGSSQPVAAILSAVRKAGYVGALAWSALSADPFSNWSGRDGKPSLA